MADRYQPLGEKCCLNVLAGATVHLFKMLGSMWQTKRHFVLETVISMNYRVLETYVTDELTYYAIFFLVFVACGRYDKLIDLRISEGYK